MAGRARQGKADNLGFSLLEKENMAIMRQGKQHNQQQVRSSGPLGASNLAAIIVYT
jgi:hypothetical protein